jgi:DNA-binding transcriptional ArsR family regulator
MSSTERLQRYLSDERGGCDDEVVAKRLAELEDIDAATGGPALDEDVSVVSALANETRYRIVRTLHVAEEELCVCEFSPLLDVSDSAISHALSQLTDAGLVSRRKDGKWRKYRITPRANALLVALDGSRG